MLLSWITAWSAFIMPILGFRPFPIAEGALILALAAGITYLHYGRAWRRVTVIGLQMAGLTFAVYRMLYLPFDWEVSFWSWQWLATCFTRQRTFVQWTGVALSLFWTAALWMGGIRLVVKVPNRLTVSGRFDLGAAAFLILLLIQLIMIGKGVPVNSDGTCEWAFLAFFMLGLVALGMTGDAEGVKKGYMASYGGVGAILSFMMLVLLFGGGLVILFLPSLMRAAAIGHDVLKAAARPLVPIFVSAVRFVFMSGCRTAQEGYRPSRQGGPGSHLPVLSHSEPDIFQSILTWGSIGLACIIGLAILVFGAYWLIRWLAARGPADDQKVGIWVLLLRLLDLFKTVFLLIPAAIRKRGHSRAGAYPYALLERWGAHCGLPRHRNETPLEYGARLTRRFQNLGNDISRIVELYNRSVYGLIEPDDQQVMSARLCWHRIRSPLNWPARLRAWLLWPSR